MPARSETKNYNLTKIHRSDKAKGNFYQISNKIVNDPRLGMDGQGLLSYLISKPDNWSFTIEQIAKDYGISVSPIRRVIKKLSVLGYLNINPIRGEHGKIFYIWEIFEDPGENPHHITKSYNGNKPIQPYNDFIP